MTSANRPTNTAGPAMRLPSLRVSAALAGVMLGVGIAIGAAIGPTPESSLASASRLPLLLPYLTAALEPHASTSSSTKPPTSSFTAPLTSPGAQTSSSPATPSTPPSEQTSGTASAVKTTKASVPSTTRNSTSSTPKSAPVTNQSASDQGQKLPNIGHVWLIVLSSDERFSAALAAPSSAAFITEGLIGAGILLTRYSALAGGELASVAAQISGGADEESVIAQPSCTASPGTPCPTGVAALKSSDEFLAGVVPQITASKAYTSSGLIVITFGAVAQGIALPGATSSTPSQDTSGTTGSPPSDGTSATPASSASSIALAGRPAAGVLVLSPLAQAGAQITTSFNPLDPRKSLEGIFGG